MLHRFGRPAQPACRGTLSELQLRDAFRKACAAGGVELTSESFQAEGKPTADVTDSSLPEQLAALVLAITVPGGEPAEWLGPDGVTIAEAVFFSASFAKRNTGDAKANGKRAAAGSIEWTAAAAVEHVEAMALILVNSILPRSANKEVDAMDDGGEGAGGERETASSGVAPDTAQVQWLLSGSGRAAVWTYAHYFEAMDAMPELRLLTKTPFLIEIVVKILPKLKELTATPESVKSELLLRLNDEGLTELAFAKMKSSNDSFPHGLTGSSAALAETQSSIAVQQSERNTTIRSLLGSIGKAVSDADDNKTALEWALDEKADHHESTKNMRLGVVWTHSTRAITDDDDTDDGPPIVKEVTADGRAQSLGVEQNWQLLEVAIRWADERDYTIHWQASSRDLVESAKHRSESQFNAALRCSKLAKLCLEASGHGDGEHDGDTADDAKKMGESGASHVRLLFARMRPETVERALLASLQRRPVRRFVIYEQFVASFIESAVDRHAGRSGLQAGMLNPVQLLAEVYEYSSRLATKMTEDVTPKIVYEPGSQLFSDSTDEWAVYFGPSAQVILKTRT